MGFKSRKEPELSKEEKLQQAVDLMREALEWYALYDNWTYEDHYGCQNCYCPRYNNVLLVNYGEGWDRAQRALESIKTLEEKE